MAVYSRENAVNYALKYGTSPNPAYNYFNVYGQDGGNCTNFVSQCLFNGGIPMDFKSKVPWWYKRNGISDSTSDTWSISWSSAHSLYWCLLKRSELGLSGLKGEKVTDMTMLDLGDIIFYENMSGRINHSAIITDFYDNIPLISQHTYEAVNIAPFKHNKSRMHFLKISS
jgi:hypothetical protein